MDAITFLSAAPPPDAALACLAPPSRDWFAQTFGVPTRAQCHAWPAVARGDNLLLCTPTGSGKTLAAFLPIIDRIRTERLTGLRCLYLAPLKALGRDARKNLKRHARAIESGDEGRVRFGLRTGDTPQRVRQQQLADPPQVLLTTPESLAVLLTRPDSREFFRALRWVVVDELHALAPTKRGADLAISLERLELLSERGLQRIGLSATCAPVETAARFLVGMDRPCSVAVVADEPDMDLQVESLPYEAAPGFMNRLLRRVESVLQANRTTLIFANTRSLAERVTWALRGRYPERVEEIAVHHSALAVARRRLVERRLKNGKLWVAVSSASLELGMDIGSVDSVVFVHPPGSVVRLLQRLGRSGHRPGEPRRGIVLTASAGDLLEAAVTADSGRHGLIEALQIPPGPLDVLCQQIAGMAMSGLWSVDEVRALVRRALPYRELSDEDFGDCFDYLCGRRDGSAWLPARLVVEGDCFTIAGESTARLLRRNLGTILTEDQWSIRLQMETRDSGDELPRTAAVGEVDEAYAERLQPGDRFMLDGRCLEMKNREDRAILVEEVLGQPQVPRWRGAGIPMSNELARRLYLFRAHAAEALRDGDAALRLHLRRDYRLGDEAAGKLVRYLSVQEALSEVPDAATLLVECLANQACVEYYLHTPLPRPANEALARVAGRRLLQSRNARAISMAGDLGLVFVFETPHVIGPDCWRDLLRADGFGDDFRAALSESLLLRERFGQVAQTGLMVLRSPRGRKRKVGGNNWAAGPLFDQLRQSAPDFVLMRQAEREAHTQACDLDTAVAFINSVPQMEVRVRALAQPSPFADRLLADVSGPLEGVPTAEEALQRLQAELLKGKAG